MPQPFFRRPRHHREGRAHGQRVQRRQRLGNHVSRAEFQERILQLLLDAPNHSLPSREIRRVIGERLARRFTDLDLSPRGGSVLWVNEMQWTKKRMVMDGLLETVLSAGHGTWRLTRKGTREAQALLV